MKQIELIWMEFAVNLRHFILNRVQDEQAADDILQNAFIKIHTHLDSLQDERKLSSWVYQITRNTIVDYYRQRRLTLPLTAELPESAPDEDKAHVHTALARSVRAMVDSLPDEYRIPLLWDTFEGLSQQEIAARLGISLSGAKSRIQRARAKLRALLLECCHFEFDRRGSVIDYHPRANCCPQCGCASTAELTTA